MDGWNFNPSCSVGLSRPAAFNTAWSLKSAHWTCLMWTRLEEFYKQRMATHLKKRKEILDRCWSQQRRNRPSCKIKLHMKVNWLLWLQKKRHQKSQKPARQWSGFFFFFESGNVWQQKPSTPRENLERNWLTKETGAGKYTEKKKQMKTKERQSRRML